MFRRKPPPRGLQRRRLEPAKKPTVPSAYAFLSDTDRKRMIHERLAALEEQHFNHELNEIIAETIDDGSEQPLLTASAKGQEVNTRAYEALVQKLDEL